MFDCGCLCEIEWNLKLFESWMRGNEMTSPNFHLAFMISMNSNSFQIQNPREKMTWLLPFKMKRVSKNIWISFGNISNLETLCNSMIFMREDKMTSSNAKKESWKFQRIKLKVPLKLFWNPHSNWSYLIFIQIIFFKNIIYGK